MELHINKQLNLLIRKDEQSTQEIETNYLMVYQLFLAELNRIELTMECMSGYNRMLRHHYWSSISLELSIRPGDICYFDFGHAYINEAGFQHFGLVISCFNHKAFVVPMTSKHHTLTQAMNVSDEGKAHLYYIGKIDGLHKPSVLFVNDARFINTARVISVNAHLPTDSLEFKKIKEALYDVIFKV